MALPLAVEPRSKALPIHSPYPYFLRLGLLGPGVFPHLFHRGLSLSWCPYMVVSVWLPKVTILP